MKNKQEIIDIYNKYKTDNNLFCITQYVNMPIFKKQPHFISVKIVERLCDLEKFLKKYDSNLKFINNDDGNSFAIIVDYYFTDYEKELKKRTLFNTDFIKRSYV